MSGLGHQASIQWQFIVSRLKVCGDEERDLNNKACHAQLELQVIRAGQHGVPTTKQKNRAPPPSQTATGIKRTARLKKARQSQCSSANSTAGD
jgi:hypothetical protein